MHDADALGDAGGEPDEIVGIEGTWEDVQSQGSMLAGHHVRVTLVSHPGRPGEGHRSANGQQPTNVGMLNALQAMQEVWKGMNPKKDDKDYLREARSGAMYDFGDDD